MGAKEILPSVKALSYVEMVEGQMMEKRQSGLIELSVLYLERGRLM